MRNQVENPRGKLRLMVISDGTLAKAGNDLLWRLERALEGGATAVMLREKAADTRTFYDAARCLREMTSRRGALLIVNDRVDIALAAQADGVHLGWRSLPQEAVRQVAGKRLLVGVSTHSIEEIEGAAGADYVTFSPVFPTPSKEGLVDVVGLEGLREASGRFTDLPLIALGGIDAANAEACMQAGAAGVAVIRAVLGPEDTAQAAATLLQKMAEDRV